MKRWVGPFCWRDGQGLILLSLSMSKHSSGKIFENNIDPLVDFWRCWGMSLSHYFECTIHFGVQVAALRCSALVFWFRIWIWSFTPSFSAGAQGGQECLADLATQRYRPGGGQNGIEFWLHDDLKEMFVRRVQVSQLFLLTQISLTVWFLFADMERVWKWISGLVTSGVPVINIIGNQLWSHLYL